MPLWVALPGVLERGDAMTRLPYRVTLVCGKSVYQTVFLATTFARAAAAATRWLDLEGLVQWRVSTVERVEP